LKDFLNHTVIYVHKSKFLVEKKSLKGIFGYQVLLENPSRKEMLKREKVFTQLKPNRKIADLATKNRTNPLQLKSQQIME